MKLGDLELYVVNDGDFKLDGGAMFGVVPKVMWSKVISHDEKNRIPMTANILLVKGADFNLLIDTGCGDKWDDKEAGIFSIKRPRGLIDNLSNIGMKAEDITHIVYTHLHFDHAGGGTYYDNNGDLQLQFPNAKIFIQKGEWDVAMNPNLRDKRSYKPENLLPLLEKNVIEFVNGDTEVLPGIKMRITGGHTKNHCIVLVESEGDTCVFNGDLIPMATHLPIPFVMAYDLYPDETMNSKIALLDEAVENDYLMVFEHGVDIPAARLNKNEKGRIVAVPVDLND
jgi:glyoxylase-like metal-dependent hydrolase (beta-lactamase superfamily II)